MVRRITIKDALENVGNAAGSLVETASKNMTAEEFKRAQQAGRILANNLRMMVDDIESNNGNNE